MASMNPKELTADELKALVVAYAKCWLAHDGCWFLTVEERRGISEAIYHDREAWRQFAPLEARRVMEARGLKPGGGLAALAEALNFRMYRWLNEQEIVLTKKRTYFRDERVPRPGGAAPEGHAGFPVQAGGRGGVRRVRPGGGPEDKNHLSAVPAGRAGRGGVLPVAVCVSKTGNGKVKVKRNAAPARGRRFL